MRPRIRPPRIAVPSARARALGDADELVAWCMDTADLMAFRDTLRHVDAVHWPTVHARLVEGLSQWEPSVGAEPPTYAAERDRRGRAAARILKLQILSQQDTARCSRDADARARRRRSLWENPPGTPLTVLPIPPASDAASR